MIFSQQVKSPSDKTKGSTIKSSGLDMGVSIHIDMQQTTYMSPLCFLRVANSRCILTQNQLQFLALSKSILIMERLPSPPTLRSSIFPIYLTTHMQLTGI